MGRLLRGTFKLTVMSGLVAGVAVAAKKLMGGLGPQPGDPAAPKEWPSLVPDPATASGNGSALISSSATASSPGIESVSTATADFERSADSGDAMTAAVGGLAEDEPTPVDTSPATTAAPADDIAGVGEATSTTDFTELTPSDAGEVADIPTTAPEAINEN